MTCLHETAQERKMKKHVEICKKRSTGDEIGLEYETMTMSNTAYQIMPLMFQRIQNFRI